VVALLISPNPGNIEYIAYTDRRRRSWCHWPVQLPASAKGPSLSCPPPSDHRHLTRPEIHRWFLTRAQNILGKAMPFLTWLSCVR
jgi:hypothetical protein